MTNKQAPQSRAQEYAGRALADLTGAQRSQLTGQSRMIAALLFAQQEEYFMGIASPTGVTVDLMDPEQIRTASWRPRAEVTERINFIMHHLFGVMEYDPAQSGPRKWVLLDEWTPQQGAAFRQALRRVLPTVAYLIQQAGEGPPITAEFQDAAMLETGAACAIIPAGPSAGRLKIRADLVVNSAALAKAQAAGQDLSKHPPVLLDGTTGRTIDMLASIARERLGLVRAVAPQEARLGKVTSALALVRNEFRDLVGDPCAVREKFPQELLHEARQAALVLISTLFVEPEKPGVVDHAGIDREFVSLYEQRKAA